MVCMNRRYVSYVCVVCMNHTHGLISYGQQKKPTTQAPSARTPARGGTSTTKGRSGQSGPSSNNNNHNTLQTRVENHNQDPRILAAEGELKTRLKNWKIAKAMSSMKAKGKGPCLRNDGKEMCHSWRAKGFCYDGCRLGYDHNESTAEEDDRFWSWCQEAYTSTEQ